MTNLEFYKGLLKERIEQCWDGPEEESTQFFGIMLEWLYEKQSGKENPKLIELLEWLCAKREEPVLTAEERRFLQDLRKYYEFDSIEIDKSCWINIKRENDFNFIIAKPNGMFLNLKSGVYWLAELGI